MASIFTLIVLLVVAVPSALWRAFVLTKLWLWYLVPAFGLSPLSLGYAYGISLIASYLTYQFQAQRTDRTTEEQVNGLVQAVLFMAFYPAVMLFAGWLGKQFM